MFIRVSLFLVIFMLFLDKNDLDNFWYSDIKRTDCFKKKRGEKGRGRRREILGNNI